MAIHSGAAERRGDDYFGPATFNRLARVLAAGHGGQVLLTGAARELAGASLPDGTSAPWTFRDLGPHRLKDLRQPEQLSQLLHPDLPAQFPPLRSLQFAAHNLPVQRTSFIGRERELAEVRGLLAPLAQRVEGIEQRGVGPDPLPHARCPLPTARLVTLSGVGGCGKTRLALQVAAEVLDEYPDGVWLADLGSLSYPRRVPAVVAQAMAVREEAGRPLVDTLTDHLRPKRALLLLDNCEHLVEATATLAEGLLKSCPQLRILATSREALGVSGELVYRVPSLGLPDPDQPPSPGKLEEYPAVRLFVERAMFNQPRFSLTERNAPAVAQVCCRLDGIPLALELAAARVKALPVEKIADRLDDRFRLLAGGSRTALPRQQTLRALIDWSYELLDEQEQALLPRLSVFAGGWTLEAAEAVCGDEDLRPPATGHRHGGPGAGRSSVVVHRSDVLDLLASLVEKSLVIYEDREEEPRYRLLETIRQYGRERLPPEEAATVRRQHLKF